MAGEVLVTNSLFNKLGSSGFGRTLYTYHSRYGRGHSAYANGYGRFALFVNDAFNLNLYYKISNTASWVWSAGTSWPNESNQWQTIYCQPAHQKYMRWQALYDARPYGDGKAYFQGTMYVRSAQPYGVGTGRYLRTLTNFGCSTSDTAPTFNTTTPMTTAHNICATDAKTSYT